MSSTEVGYSKNGPEPSLNELDTNIHYDPLDDKLSKQMELAGDREVLEVKHGPDDIDKQSDDDKNKDRINSSIFGNFHPDKIFTMDKNEDMLKGVSNFSNTVFKTEEDNVFTAIEKEKLPDGKSKTDNEIVLHSYNNIVHNDEVVEMMGQSDKVLQECKTDSVIADGETDVITEGNEQLTDIVEKYQKDGNFKTVEDIIIHSKVDRLIDRLPTDLTIRDLKDKTMADKLINILNQDTQNYRFCM